MVSAPSGSGAPVKMRTASPAPTEPSKLRLKGEAAAGRRLALQPQPRRGHRDVGRAHGVAVHCRSGEGRLGAQGEERLGEDAVRRLADRHGFGRSGLDAGQQALQCRVDGQQGHGQAPAR